jgi:predicted ATPase
VSRFEAQHETKLTPLVGRDEELELLLRRWRQAVGGEGRVVLLSGEPGIGKSRLTVALEEQLQTDQYTPLRFFCSPLHTDSTLYPFISQLERAAGFERNDTMEAKHDKLSSLLGVLPKHDNDVQLLAELLSVPTGDCYPPLNLSARQKKQKTIEALVRQLEVLVRGRPVLMIFEDAHWIDPSSRELLDTTIERAARLPVLLVIAFRPEFHPPWTGQAHVTALNLSRLGRREGAALAGSVAGNNVLPEEIVEEIIERTDGIPLFVEELQLLETSEEGIRRYDPKRHAQLSETFGGHDPGVCALACHAMGLSLRGLPDQARRTVERTLALAGSLLHPPSSAWGHAVAGCFMIVRDRHGCERAGARSVSLAEKFDLPMIRWWGRYHMGWGKAQGLTLSEGLALMEEAFPRMVNEGHYKFFGAALAEARFDAGRVTDALALVDHAVNTGQGPASGQYVAEIHRLRGVFLKSLGSPAAEVERALRTAIEIAEKQGALLLKLRAATSLGRLWLDQGKRDEARDLLAPIYGWFTEGFDTRDLKEAKALLEELHA